MKIENYKRHGDKLLIALVLVFLAATLYRLLSNETPGKPDVPIPTIVFTQWWEDSSDKEIFNKLINEFEILNDNIKIVLNTMTYDDLQRDLFNSDKDLSEGDSIIIPGDIIALDPLWVPELLKKEIIEDAHAPLVSSINVLYYNIDALKEAGFLRPPKTRSEFLSYSGTLAGREGNRRASARGIASSLTMALKSSRGIYDDVFPWIWSAGAQLLQDGKPTANSRPVVESLAFLASMYNEGLIISGPFSVDSKKKRDDFVSGRVAFMIAPSSDIRLIREHMGDESFGITSIPTPDNYFGKVFFGTAAWTVGVSAASAYKEEAKRFVDFLTEKAFFLSEQARAIPGNDLSSAQDDLYSKVWDITIAGEIAPDFSGLPWTELEAAFREELATLFAQNSSPADTAARIQKRWEDILERIQ